MSGFWESFTNLFKKETDEEKKEKARIKKQRKRLDQVIGFLEKALKEKDLDDIKQGAELLQLVLLKEYKHYCPDGILNNAKDDDTFSREAVIAALNENLTNRIKSFGLFLGKLCTTFSPKKYNSQCGSLDKGLINNDYMQKLFDVCKQCAAFFTDEVDVKQDGSYDEIIAKNRKLGFAEADRIFVDAEKLYKVFSTPWENKNNKKFNSDQKNEIDKLIDNIQKESEFLKQVINKNKSESNQ